MTKNISEADTRANYIDPKLIESDWTSDNIEREYYFTDGRKLLGNQRGKRLYLDYLLKFNNINLGLIEAKRSDEHPTKGLQQAIDYAEKLKIDFVYSTNGKQIYEFNRTVGKGDYIEKFPTPQELYNRLYGKNIELKKKLHNIPFYLTGAMRPRYYQEIAVNKVLENIAEEKKRILLTLATGTGKTFISFQIVHKLFQAKWNIDGENRRPRILFLADRNVLADQAINTFNPYEKDLVKINGEEVKSRNGVVPTNAFIFFAIYQAIAERENIGAYYKSYPADFFDLIIIDECHRGSADEDGSWRAILSHFNKAVHLGLTATPKREDNVDTYKYFGKPIYEYSLSDGINDGFLTPYKVKRIRTNIDEYIHTNDNKVIQGEIKKDRYDINDFDKSIIIPKRTDLIARAILNNIGKMEKTIVFCVNQDHALELRDMINKHKTVSDSNYCVRVTSDEGKIGRNFLEAFQDNDKDIPVILTSSKMLTTGIDARNVRNIVLTSPIGSIVEFKQIIGRGTRVYDGKDFFTIIDFAGATDLFYDSAWDGIPEDETETYETGEINDEKIRKKTSVTTIQEPKEEYGERKEKLIIELSNGRILKVIDVDIRYIDENGKPLTVREFLEKLVGELPAIYQDENHLRKIWANPDTRKELLAQLGTLGFEKEQLDALRDMIASPECDIFDVLSHISFSSDIKTRRERASAVRNDNFFTIYQNLKAREFLEYVLNHYEKFGIEELQRERLGDLVKLKLGTPKDAKVVFGDMKNLLGAYYQLQQHIYQAV
ncbi:EcoAI/FtnUII family type I restriction enzme subunit R [Flavobacterium lindanitolerans]|uniref:Type I restriction enzyme R subunit n=1 Tax=Flavobacterium lindanitolerans TaxID=428988 RepID=A0A497UD38_9FLAO|nr:DEAD/DEAH box helicase family protein [Flavobacterium lindanitolerans]PKW20536.1 type I restriction enzyme R subunit [Flavobacterium lindanitolerans]RLJ23979.1 type I restriction enzyme R subunit [Flavobacterium lindanitolerans]